MNLNPGREDLRQDAESSPIRTRGYINPDIRSSPPARHASGAGNYLFPSIAGAIEPLNPDVDEDVDNDSDGRCRI